MSDDKSHLQLATPISISPNLYIDSNDYWAEEKYDGDRITVGFTPSGLVITTRKGSLAHTPKCLQTLAYQGWPVTINGTTLDGELLNTCFMPFDVTHFRDTLYASAPYCKRRELLEAILTNIELPGVLLPMVFKSPDDKRLLIETVYFHDGEGVIFKHVNAPYAPGRSQSWIKYKFYKTCEVRIAEMNRNGKPEGVSIEMLIDGSWAEVGGCKIPMRYQIEQGIDTHDIIEVRYLKVTGDKKLYEPVFLKKRTDKVADDCTWSQVETNRA